MADKEDTITPNVLKWARVTARMSEEIAASKVAVSIDKLKEWEQGTNQPTIRQAQFLSLKYIKDLLHYFFFQKYLKIFNHFKISEEKGSK